MSLSSPFYASCNHREEGSGASVSMFFNISIVLICQVATAVQVHGLKKEVKI